MKVKAEKVGRIALKRANLGYCTVDRGLLQMTAASHFPSGRVSVASSQPQNHHHDPSPHFFTPSEWNVVWGLISSSSIPHSKTNQMPNMQKKANKTTQLIREDASNQILLGQPDRSNVIKIPPCQGNTILFRSTPKFPRLRPAF